MARLLLQEALSQSPPYNPNLVLILAVLLCALTCILGLIAVTRCSWFRRINSSRSDQTNPSPLANKGLKKKVLKSLPKLTYSTDSKLVECAICLTEFVAGDEVRVLPQCGHGFHVACIDMWLGSHSSCPSCRQILVVANNARCLKCGGGLPSGSESDTRIQQSENDPNSILS